MRQNTSCGHRMQITPRGDARQLRRQRKLHKKELPALFSIGFQIDFYLISLYMERNQLLNKKRRVWMTIFNLPRC
jgi:hypothetical protein